jgi:transposase
VGFWESSSLWYERFPTYTGELAMGEFIMVGCDLHDQSMLLRIAVGRRAAETVSVRNTRAGRARMVADLLARAKRAGEARVIFAYEASGQGFGLHDELTDAGLECHVLAPTKIARSQQQRRAKTDEKDAEQLLELLRAHVLAGNALPGVWIPDPQTRDDREVVRARLDAAEKAVAVKAQIQGLLKRHRQVRPEGVKGSWSKSFWAWLRGLATNPAHGPGMRVTLSSLLRQLEFLEQEIERLEKALGELAAAPRYVAPIQALVKLQGVGLLTALVFLTEVGDLGRFANRRQISAYLGLVPRSYESGAQQNRKGHITRQGPSRVRRVLCQAAWSRVREERVDHAAYQRIALKNPQHKKIAVVAMMRRLAVQMWHQGQQPPPEATPSGEGRRTIATAAV